ncbi:MAG: ATP-binding protein [Chloroflexota bacterium]
MMTNPARPSYFPRLPNRDIRLKLITQHLLLALIGTALVLFFLDTATNQLQNDIRESDIALAQAIAIQFDNQASTIGEASQNISNWLNQVWGSQIAVITIVNAQGQNIMQLRGGTSLLEDSDWSSWTSWQREVIKTTQQSSAGSFISRAPNGERWLHAFVSTPDSQSKVIIQRPTSLAFSTIRLLRNTSFIALTLYLISLLLFWFRLSFELISPLQKLEQFSSTVTQRGPLSPRDWEAVKALGSRKDQVGTLARALQAMGKLYEKTDGQLREKSRQLEATINSIDIGIILEGAKGEVLYSNRQISAWVNKPSRQLIGCQACHLIDALVDPDSEQSGKSILEEMDRAPDEGVELTRIGQGGRQQDLYLHRFYVTDRMGGYLGAGQIWQDITPYKEVDRMKSALLSTISHELRTPLTTILGYAQSLLAEDIHWDERRRQKFISRIYAEATRFKALVDGLLDMIRLEGGRLSMNRHHFSLNDCLQSALETLDLQHNPRLKFECDPNLPLLYIDPMRIQTVIRNYLNNAIKYAPGDSIIEVITRREKGHIHFVVKDEGRSLKSINTHKLFEPFHRQDNRYTRAAGGVGLGLAISKGFIEAHAGAVWVDTDDESTAFGFSIPIENE